MKLLKLWPDCQTALFVANIVQIPRESTPWSNDECHLAITDNLPKKKLHAHTCISIIRFLVPHPSPQSAASPTCENEDASRNVSAQPHRHRPEQLEADNRIGTSQHPGSSTASCHHSRNREKAPPLPPVPASWSEHCSSCGGSASCQSCVAGQGSQASWNKAASRQSWIGWQPLEGETFLATWRIDL